MTQNVVLAVNTSAAARTPVYFSMTGAAAAAVVVSSRPLTAAQAFAPYFWKYGVGPSGVHDVHEHQRVVVGQVDVDVVGRVIRAVQGQVDAFAADLQGAAVREGLFGRGPGRVVVSRQELPSLLVPDAARWML
jgi:hypothetical protein